MQAALIGALNGVIGDYLKSTETPLAVKLSFYGNGGHITDLLEDAEIRFPHWKDTAAVFLHGGWLHLHHRHRFADGDLRCAVLDARRRRSAHAYMRITACRPGDGPSRQRWG